MAEDFIPGADGDLVLWCQNNIDTIDDHGPGTESDITADIVSAVKTESAAKIASINAKIKAEEDYGSAVATDKDTTLTELRRVIGDAKRITTVKDTALENLGWKGVERIGDHYKFNYSLQAFFTGVVPYRKKPEDTDWVRQREDHSSPWFENEMIPEGTTYRFRYLLKEDEVGQWSDIITIDV
jgi:hypothetical protein